MREQKRENGENINFPPFFTGEKSGSTAFTSEKKFVKIKNRAHLEKQKNQDAQK